MPKLTTGGVAITAMKQTGTLSLKSGTDYQVGEEHDLVKDLMSFGQKEKAQIAAFIPEQDELKKDGGFTSAQIGEFIEKGFEPTLMIGFGNGFPAPYLALFDPSAKRSGPTRKKAKPSKFARK